MFVSMFRSRPNIKKSLLIMLSWSLQRPYSFGKWHTHNRTLEKLATPLATWCCVWSWCRILKENYYYTAVALVVRANLGRWLDAFNHSETDYNPGSEQASGHDEVKLSRLIDGIGDVQSLTEPEVRGWRAGSTLLHWKRVNNSQQLNTVDS